MALLSDFQLFLVLTGLSCVYAVIKLWNFGSREKYLPPGPPTWPVLGNAHLLIDAELGKKSVKEKNSRVSLSPDGFNQVQRME